MDLKLVNSSLDSLGNLVEKVPSELAHDLSLYTNELLEVRHSYSAVHTECQKLAHYFGEEAETSGEIFAVVSKFLVSLQRAKEDNQNRKYLTSIRPRNELAPPFENLVNSINSDKLYIRTLVLLKNGSIFRKL